MFSSFHSVPRKLAVTGLSSLASRKGLAANPEVASKLDMIAIVMCWRFFIRQIVAGERLTLHVRNSQSETCESVDPLCTVQLPVAFGHPGSCSGNGEV